MKNVADIYPLSPVQLGMLFHTLAQLDEARSDEVVQKGGPASGVYVNQYTCRLSGTVQPDLLRQAWEQTVDRHAVLRTAFLWDGLDEPLQIVRQTVKLPWQVLDWCGLEASAQMAQLDAFLKQDRMQGFELAKAPVLRLTLIKLAPDAFQLVWSSHHMLFDGWSLPLIWQDMLAYYGGLIKGTAPQLAAVKPYRDYIAWQQARATDEAVERAKGFWRASLGGASPSQLSGFTEPTPLPAARTTAEVVSGPYHQQATRLDAAFTQRIIAFARQHRLTLNTLIQGAWTLLLHHFSGDSQVIHGSVVSGRPADLRGVEKMVGLFINTLPVRSVIEPEQTLVTWLAEKQQQLLSLREYETTALTDVQRWSDMPAGSALFDSIVVFENYPAADTPDVGFTVEQVRYLEQSNYPLALLVVPGDALELLLLYDMARFEGGAIARLLSHLELLLNAFVERPQAKLCELSRLTADERASLEVFLAVAPPQPAKASLMIHRLIEAQVAKTPQAEAVVFAGESLTYEALNRRANQLAVVLREHNVAPGSRVALCLNRSLEMVVCILAVLKAGAAYVPLDPDYPQRRLAYCLEDTDPIVICTERAVELPAVEVPLLYVEDASLYESSYEASGPDATDNLSDSAGPEDLAYIIYTSGSTGQPKGVMVSHRNLVHSTEARFSVYDESVGRFLLLSSIAFDSSVAGLFWTLCQGGTLVISPPRIEQDLQQLAELIAKERITHTLCVPTLYALLIATVDPVWLATLRTVIVAGEACAKSLVKQHYERLPQVQLYNEYGPTESTVWCTAYPVPSVLPPGPVAIGMAIPDTQIVLLDEHLQPVPTGAVGEICVGGAGVSQGYWRQEQKTAAVFLEQRFYRTGDLGRWRADGTLEWLGRRDRQVKIRGYRIELGEIEEALRSHSSVQEAVVVSHSQHQDLTSNDAVVSERSEIESLAQALAALPTEDAAALIAMAEEMPAAGGA